VDRWRKLIDGWEGWIVRKNGHADTCLVGKQKSARVEVLKRYLDGWMDGWLGG
jgi:hypothetical protein